ncbi:MAG: thiamine pyrophosphate-dependent dehydrogenase E1 component subunit alpha [Nitrospirae bacterium]|nr:thiamine pyrophosphate-dependent dehydrogenase E1 component subunit alpha [Nitrospirota bacterium]
MEDLTLLKIELYKKMLLIRRFEEKIRQVYSAQDMKTPVHLCIGQEAIAAGVCINLRKTDYMVTNHRGHGHCLAKGSSPKSLLSEYYGRITGCAHGKGGSMHPVDPENGILGTSAIVGGGIPIAVGTALASKLRKDGNITVVFFGDGASEEGTFHESLNFASLKKLPILFVCENNLYATNSNIKSRQPNIDIAKKAQGYGLNGVVIDGNNVMDVYNAAKSAIEMLRDGQSPSLIEYKTYRWFGHVGPDYDHEKGLRGEEELKVWLRQCPLKSFVDQLLKDNILTLQQIDEMDNEMDETLNDAISYAKSQPYPDISELYKDLFYEGAI